MHYFIEVVIIGMYAGASLLAQAIPGSAEGLVVDQDGRGIAGAVVTALGRPAIDAGGLPRTVSSTITRDDGSFLMLGFSSGDYLLCAQTPKRDLINPCEWETSFVPVRFTLREQKTGLRIVMEKGIQVRVRILDPDELLDKHVGKTNRASWRIGYWHSRKPFTPLQPIDITKKQRNYVVPIPFGKKVEFGIYGRFFQVEDLGGRPVDDKNRVGLMLNRGDTTAQEIVLRVKAFRN